MRPQFDRICTNINVKNRKISKKNISNKTDNRFRIHLPLPQECSTKRPFEMSGGFHTETTIHEKSVSQEGKVK